MAQVYWTPPGSGGSGEIGENGATFFPSVSDAGVVSWTNDKGLENPDPVNIMGPAGADGAPGAAGAEGATFYPTVSETGDLSWENDAGLENPDPVNIMGKGVPTGGQSGQVLAKSSDADFETEWIDPPEGGGDGGVGIASIEQTTTSLESGGENIITVTKTDGSIAGTFSVRNGAAGVRKITTNATIYSENEMVAGRWTNNKPLYRRVISGVLPSTAEATEFGDVVIENVEELVDQTGYMIDSNDGTSYPLPRHVSDSDRCEFTITENKIGVEQGTDAYGRAFAVALQYTKTTDLPIGSYNVFGVEWDYSNPSTSLTRLTCATDPNRLVTVDVTEEPSPAVGSEGGSSLFDGYLPWSGMEEYNVIDGVVSHRKGEAGFSRTQYDTVVKIPKFWYKIETDVSSSTMRFYIADGPEAGFEVHGAFDRGDGVERDCIYVGRYHTINGYYSKSGANPLGNITRATARTNSAAKGTGWWQYDYATLTALQLLYLVEFADWDSQARIGQGNTASDSSIQNTGGTDSMIHHTGRAAGTDGQVQTQYRGIEEMWGNVFYWVDGCNFNDRAAYVCLNPANYADGTSMNYIAVGLTLPSSRGYIKRISASTIFPWAIMPTEIGGSETTYVTDHFMGDAGWRTLFAGGFVGYSLNSGMFVFRASKDASSTSANIGARLMFLP